MADRSEMTFNVRLINLPPYLKLHSSYSEVEYNYSEIKGGFSLSLSLSSFTTLINRHLQQKLALRASNFTAQMMFFVFNDYNSPLLSSLSLFSLSPPFTALSIFNFNSSLVQQFPEFASNYDTNSVSRKMANLLLKCKTISIIEK